MTSSVCEFNIHCLKIYLKSTSKSLDMFKSFFLNNLEKNYLSLLFFKGCTDYRKHTLIHSSLMNLQNVLIKSVSSHLM